MSEGAASPADSPTDRVRASVSVRVPPHEAFALFTGHIDAWWKRGVRFRHGGARSGALVHLEPREGGRLFESFTREGGEPVVVEVGRVLVWEPPSAYVPASGVSPSVRGKTRRVEPVGRNP
jgi:hypothetical protein